MAQEFLPDDLKLSDYKKWSLFIRSRLYVIFFLLSYL